jgi:uncharacterized membrane protein
VSPEAYIKIAIAAAQLCFFAGGAWMIVKNIRKDVNGLGKAFRDSVKLAERRHRVLIVAIIKSAPDAESKDRAAELLLED